MKITYVAQCYRPQSVKKHYVRVLIQKSENYKWCEVDVREVTIREGFINQSELPKEIKKRADERRAQSFGWVQWLPNCTHPQGHFVDNQGYCHECGIKL